MTTQQLFNNRSKFGLIYDTRIHILSAFNLSPKRDQQIFRTAFIQSACILFLFICVVCAWLVYHILEPFFHSILWSILTGAFLFPFKNHFTSQARYHLDQFDKHSYLLIYGLIFILPLKIFDQILESIFPLCIQKWKEFILILIFLPSIELFQSGVIYHCLITIVDDYLIQFEKFFHFFDSLWIIFIILIYFFAVLTIYNSSLIIKSLLNIFSIPIWFILFIYLSQYLSINYRFIGIILIGIFLVIGFIFNRNINEFNHSKTNQHQNSIFINLLNIFRRIQVYFHTKSSSSTLPSSSSSTRYFTFVLWLLVAIKIYEFSWYLIPITIFIFIYKMIKSFLIYTYIYLSKQTYLKQIFQQIIHFWKIRRDALIPMPLNIIIRCIRKGDKQMNHYLQNSMDYLISALMIVILFILIVFSSIFLLIQIQHESIHMIKLASNFVNDTNIFQHILPDKENMNNLMDKILKKFYIFGRNWITTQVVKVQPPRVEPICCLPLSVRPSESPYMHINTIGQGSLSNKNLEEQVLQLWDRLYTYLTNTSTLFISQKNRTKIFYSPIDQTFLLPNFYTYIQNNFYFHFNDLYRLVHDNLDLLRTIFDSICSNTSILLTLLSTIISLLFTSGFALFNFLVSFIVFITLLFYLLSYSDQSIYRPTVWLNNILAIGNSSLGTTVNDVVTSIFIASLKISAFYGVYTYVLHSLVGSNVVFIPAVIASICAVTLQSYWGALPGCLDLWLVQQRPLSALILFIAQIIPVYVVDTAIYSEVKGGGHQYLTALAIAGGVYYRGIEGALVGPMILCCLLVGIRMYNEIMAEALLSKSDILSLSLTKVKQHLSRSLSLQPEMTKK